jgi:hypothetical protein
MYPDNASKGKVEGYREATPKLIGHRCMVNE